MKTRLQDFYKWDRVNFEQDRQKHCALGREEGGGGFKLSKEETDVSARTRMCVREGGSERAHSFASDDDQPPPGDFPIKHGSRGRISPSLNCRLSIGIGRERGMDACLVSEE